MNDAPALLPAVCAVLQLERRLRPDVVGERSKGVAPVEDLPAHPHKLLVAPAEAPYANRRMDIG